MLFAGKTRQSVPGTSAAAGAGASSAPTEAAITRMLERLRIAPPIGIRRPET
jgi:hypothetical protein